MRWKGSSWDATKRDAWDEARSDGMARDMQWFSQEQTNRGSLNVINFHWLLLIINSWLWNRKNPGRHLLKSWLNVVANTTTAARSVEICTCCLVKGYHHCPFKVKEGEVVACEQDLLFGQAKWASRERASEAPLARAFSRDSLHPPK